MTEEERLRAELRRLFDDWRFVGDSVQGAARLAIEEEKYDAGEAYTDVLRMMTRTLRGTRS